LTRKTKYVFMTDDDRLIHTYYIYTFHIYI